MRLHLMTATGAQQFGNAWRIEPSVSLRSLVEQGPGMTMPMPGEQLELHLPDGREIAAFILSFGMDAWKDAEGNLYTTSDPSSPSLTLTISGAPSLEGVPAGTEIWLSNATSSTAHHESSANSAP